jgi:hypothetical protein
VKDVGLTPLVALGGLIDMTNDFAVAVVIAQIVGITTDVAILLEEVAHSVLDSGSSELLARREHRNEIVLGEHGNTDSVVYYWDKPLNGN